jgi:SAM-dependent methyltransferase
MNRKMHWEELYREKSPQEVSWYQEQPKLSLELIESLQLNKSARILDVGGGASRLAKSLLDAGYENISVLDISAKALQQAKNELGAKSTQIEWIVTNVFEFEPSKCFDLWHDRALFHFLTEADDRKSYVEVLKKSLSASGFVIIASFAIGGPEECSGLPIVQYDAQKISQELGDEFRLLNEQFELHHTPWSSEQKFMYSLFQRNRSA